MIDPSNNKVLIPPGEVGVSAGLIFDPVGTGVDGNLIFAPNVHNITVVRAENEYRTLFKAVNYVGNGDVTTLGMLGNHCDIGGGYDRGLGSLTLQAANSFFKNSGITMSDVPASRVFAPDAGVYIHDEGFDGVGDARHRVWDTYSSVETDIGAVRQVSDRTSPPYVEIDPSNTKTISEYTDAYGNQVHYERQTDGSGNFQEGTMKITTPDGNYVQHVYNNLYHEIEHEWTDTDGYHWEKRHEDGWHASGYDFNDGSSHTEVYYVNGMQISDTETTDHIYTRISTRPDGSSVKYVEYPDGSEVWDTHYPNGDEDIDSLSADGSEEEISSYGTRKSHDTYSSTGAFSETFSDVGVHGSSTDDGHGNTTSDVWNDDGSGQHNWKKSDGTYLRETDHADLTYDRYLKNSEGTTIEIHTRTDSGYTEHDKLVDDEVHHNHVIDIQYDGVNKWLDKKDAYDAVNGDHIVHREFVSDDGANTITSDSVSHLDGSSDYHEVSVTNGIKKTEDLHDADTSLRTYDSVLVFVNPDGSNSRETEHVVNGYLTSHFEQQSASGSFIKDVQLPDISAPDTYDYVSTSTSVDGSDTVQETWHVINKIWNVHREEQTINTNTVEDRNNSNGYVYVHGKTVYSGNGETLEYTSITYEDGHGYRDDVVTFTGQNTISQHHYTF